MRRDSIRSSSYELVSSWLSIRGKRLGLNTYPSTASAADLNEAFPSFILTERFNWRLLELKELCCSAGANFEVLDYV